MRINRFQKYLLLLFVIIFNACKDDNVQAVPGAIIGAVGAGLKYGIAGAIKDSGFALACTMLSHWD